MRSRIRSWILVVIVVIVVASIPLGVYFIKMPTAITPSIIIVAKPYSEFKIYIPPYLNGNETLYLVTSSNITSGQVKFK